MIERRFEMPLAEFQRYRAENRPVILTNFPKWPLIARWTPEFLRETCGDVQVQVLIDRDKNSEYEQHYDEHRGTMLMSEYVDRVLENPFSNDIYMHAQNSVLRDTDAGRRLYSDLPALEYVRLDSGRMGDINLWFGPGGTVTPLHHDDCDILYLQIYGRKMFTLFSPRQSHLLYHEGGYLSRVDIENPDLLRYPGFRFASGSKFVLNPGDLLLIPVKWWHHVRALDVSISLSFANLR